MAKGFKPVALGPAIGVPPTLEWIAVERLQIDPEYQRTIDGQHSRKIIVGMVKAWDWALCQPLVVSRRADGGLFILDGQHRHAGAVERGDLPHLPCVVLTDRDAPGEAAAFVALNTRRQRLTQTAVFAGMLAAGDEHAAATAQMLRETGWSVARHDNPVAYKPGDLGCAPMLAKAVKTHGEAAVRNALTALREAYPDVVVSNAATLLKALLTIYRDKLLDGIDCDTFIGALGAIPPTEWLDEARDQQRRNPAWSRPEALAEAMLAAACDEQREAA